MPQHQERRLLPYTAAQVFALVADVAKYPEFLPWCAGARINWRKENVFNADVMIGYKALRETLNSNVLLTKDSRIDVSYQSGPFSSLSNHWTFKSVRINGKNHCEVTFFIDFTFRSNFLSGVIKSIFEEAVRRMIVAFEKRAAQIYK